MAQTTNGLSFKDCKVEISQNGSAWTDISGFAASVEVGGGERATGEAYTFDGNTPILMPGKLGVLEVKVKIVYTEGGSDPQEVVRQVYEAASAIYVRWTPKGSGAGSFRYTTSIGVAVTPPYPGGEADNPDPLVGEFTIKVRSIVKDTI